jgi:hypothetical protein
MDTHTTIVYVHILYSITIYIQKRTGTVPLCDFGF